MLKKLNKNQKGFTLVELIIVIAILGVLAALLVPRIMGNVDDATVNRNISNARTVASEITVHNAQKKIENKEIEMVVATGDEAAGGKKLKKSDITASTYKLPDSISDFPIPGVEIIIDAKGNASVDY